MPNNIYQTATFLITLAGMLGGISTQSQADVVAVPLTNSEIERAPYKFNGVILASVDSRGSGAVVGSPKTVLSCAHLVFDDSGLLDPWMGDVRWFWKYRDEAEPVWESGQLLRGYTRFTSYQFATDSRGINYEGAFAWDAVVHYAYEPLAGGEAGARWINGIAALTNSTAKIITGYPAGNYLEGETNRNKMHVTGPFTTPLKSDRGAYMGAEGIAAGSGNSGGPVWVQDASGAWLDAGIYVSGLRKLDGAEINTIGVRALDADAWALFDEAIRTTSPSNDNFSDAALITGFPVTLTASNVGSTKEPKEMDHGDDAGGRSVWWRWTSPVSGPVTIHTIGSDFDTQLSIYRGNALTNLSRVAIDDESGGDGTSLVTFTAVANTEYRIAVDGFFATSGKIVLNILAPPRNDAFENRIALNGIPISTTGSNVGATKEFGEPNQADNLGGSSLWWTWTAPIEGTIVLDTVGSSARTLLAVYGGTSLTTLSPLAAGNGNAGNGASRVTFSARAGAAYQFAVDGFGGSIGKIVLNLHQGLTITAQPRSQIVEIGAPTFFVIQTTGSSATTYQWRKDGVNLIGATNSFYPIANVQSNQGGEYSVVVQDSFTNQISTFAKLIVTSPYTFVTWAGTPRYGSSDGRGGNARFFGLSSVAVDITGNLYVSDSGNHLIRKITPDGTVSVLAGSTGISGSADGTVKTAKFNSPLGVAIDSAGNVFVADSFNNTIRKITPAGIVSTPAGSLRNFPGGIDGFGNTSRFYGPNRIAIDASGNLLVADTLNHTIRKLSPTGAITTLAGKAGDIGSANGPGIQARFAFPRSVAADSAGNIYVADSGNDVIRKITPTGGVSTFAGVAGTGGSIDGPAGVALFSDPNGVAVDLAGNVYVADSFNATIRKITRDGTASTLAGSPGKLGCADGKGSVARFYSPTGLTVDGFGNIYLADTGNETLRKITPDGTVTTIAGKASFGNDDGPGESARFNALDGLTADDTGNVYVADNGNHTIRKIDPTGVVSTLAGSPENPGSTDGTRTEARFDHPESPAVDNAGNVYVPDSRNHTIRKITPDGQVSTFAGSAGIHGDTDGPGNEARFFYPFATAVDGAGTVFVADGYNNTIRRILPGGSVTTLAGLAGNFGHADGAGNAASFDGPESLALDASGNIFAADFGNHTIRKITREGIVSTFAGNAGLPGITDGPGDVARFSNPAGVTVDKAGNIFVADSGNHTIRIITPDGAVNTVAGSPGKSGSVDGIGSVARFLVPFGVAADGLGNIYVSDAGNNTIRKGLPFAITGQPTNLTASVGEKITFNITAVSAIPLNYQWRKSGTNLLGALGPNLTLSNIQPADAGTYSVLLSSAAGILTSSDAVLTIDSGNTKPPPIFTEPQPDLVVLDSPAGDFVGAGQTIVITNAAEFTLTGTPKFITVAAAGFSIQLDAPGDDDLHVGLYTNAVHYPFNGAQPGVSITGNGRGCNTILGEFEILELHRDTNGNLDHFWAKFSQSCEGSMPSLVGEVRYHSLLAENHPPVALDDRIELDEDTSAFFSPVANDRDPDGDVLKFELLTQPANGQLTLTNNGVLFVPTPNFYGTNSFNYLVLDGHAGSATGLVTLVVRKVNDLPVAKRIDLIAQGNELLTQQLQATDNDSTRLDFFITTPPSHGLAKLDKMTGQLSYQPVHGFSGLDTMKFAVSDGGANSLDAEVRILVQSPLDADKDGMADAWQKLYDLGNPAADEDGDGVSNLNEYLANTSPRDPKSRLQILSITRDKSGQTTIQWSSIGGTRYRIWSGDNVGTGRATEFHETVRPVIEEIDPAPYGKASTQTYVDSSPPPISGARFYMVGVAR